MELTSTVINGFTMNRNRRIGILHIWKQGDCHLYRMTGKSILVSFTTIVFYKMSSVLST